MFYFHATKSFHVIRHPGTGQPRRTGRTAPGSTTLLPAFTAPRRAAPTAWHRHTAAGGATITAARGPTITVAQGGNCGRISCRGVADIAFLD
jgi:hypothetical protein